MFPFITAISWGLTETKGKRLQQDKGAGRIFCVGTFEMALACCLVAGPARKAPNF